jgi:hypothetical protein
MVRMSLLSKKQLPMVQLNRFQSQQESTPGDLQLHTTPKSMLMEELLASLQTPSQPLMVELEPMFLEPSVMDLPCNTLCCHQAPHLMSLLHTSQALLMVVKLSLNTPQLHQDMSLKPLKLNQPHQAM